MPATGFTVRALDTPDAAAYRDLRLLGLRESPSAFGSSYEETKDVPLEEQAKRIKYAPEQGVIIGAFEQNLVGIGGIGRCDRLKEKHKAWIWGLYVHPDFRGRGLARAIMVQLMDYARANEDIIIVNLTVTSTNLSAKRLYEDLGFRTIGHEPKALRVAGVFYDWDHLSMEITRGGDTG
jgi:RimJ/RimL family protein N-acetyltransferase